ncbi:MAG: RNA polymerase subunit sigma-24 [Bacteroidetes bacterium CG02_land_8_20_14_3_00_31_25]|nr:sigma-70 family RNA polymerase sigma factor [Bacteroidota bacterium]PIV58240.1 MAG: RNA polymerase subunit sigma-24 [Bacteroidetes bacterium CG02_land_8_20_14_3_00_31_25]PIX36062.1 MAG: RNA polymerase subunit sigma-24 [Bacteroidetes bacterium CG_4_8_14_3_um_filter_31_14]PIY04865.1 MAG: RNA polymerase subunit sigma-24 [Bacteroidetes bacterium CG_4_10_14_3_um_filter_31_20]
MKQLEIADNELINEFISGNQQAIETLIKRHKRKVFTYILMVVRNREVAEDIFQETFIKVFKSISEGKYTDDGKFIAWVMRIAHNLIIDNVRREKRLKTISSDDYEYDIFNHKKYSEQYKEQSVIKEEVETDLKRIVNELPDVQKQVVIMRHFMDMSFKEIAEETGVSINTALGRMRYAIINMRKIIDEKKINLLVE